MRKIDKFEKVNGESFKRLVGVKRTTFNIMLEEYKKAEIKRNIYYPKKRQKNILNK